MRTAWRRARVPGVGGYLVWSFSMARMPACLMCSGVGKSGSPTLKPMTSMPSARIFLNCVSMAMVVDARTDWASVDNAFINSRPPNNVNSIDFHFSVTHYS